ncbi:ethanolamine ammonia-lyase subunit EutC [Priestia megaterium]|uniref:ethanolamine ammonia-lyase subunit EutC n=1 Tax=Priestia megaterium TaxID=1404 RepID=UPI002D7EB26F|nr:ethanolamine ammonia-lyase subunit EutC [Priestia megaterium]MEB4868269.1 ethanolamine ammonia-lyase subunit EutC [Priestia megaterium]
MNPELIEKITRSIVEKLEQQSSFEQSSPTDDSQSSVTFWAHTSNANKKVINGPLAEVVEDGSEKELIKFPNIQEFDSTSLPESKMTIPQEEKDIESKQQVAGIKNPVNQEELDTLIQKTPARIGIGRAGLRPRTETWLKFRYDHAAAVDAVYGNVNDDLLKRLNLFKVNTQVTDKEVYIRRPDYGRKLSDEAKKCIQEKCIKSPTVQIIVSDGLSSKAIEENVEDVYLSLQQSLKSADLDVGVPFYIEKGRVAVMDDIGELLTPKVVVLLIGERPGLISAESLSAYLCYEPRKGMIEAERMVVSNIHKGGIPPVEAGAYLGTLVQKILKYEASGVSLVQKEQ